MSKVNGDNLSAEDLSALILSWLIRRNGGALAEVFDNMTIGDTRRLHAELAHILELGGKLPTVPNE